MLFSSFQSGMGGTPINFNHAIHDITMINIIRVQEPSFGGQGGFLFVFPDRYHFLTKIILLRIVAADNY